MADISNNRLAQLRADEHEISQADSELQRRRAETRQEPGYERCDDCGGTGLALNGNGEPDECRTCGGNTVTATPEPLPAGTVTDEMVEQAAEALWLAQGGSAWLYAREDEKSGTRVEARATIEAAFAARPAEPVGMKPYAEIVAPYVSALRMVREAIGELFGPAASIESDEAVLFRGPEPTHEAEAQIAALQRIRSALATAPPVPDSVVEAQTPIRPEIKSEIEILERLAAGDAIAFSQDGDDAFFVNGDRAFVGRVLLTMRSKGYIKRVVLDDENYRGLSERDVISDAGRKALASITETGGAKE